jgi:hypothetical protein
LSFDQPDQGIHRLDGVARGGHRLDRYFRLQLVEEFERRNGAALAAAAALKAVAARKASGAGSGPGERTRLYCTAFAHNRSHSVTSKPAAQGVP